MDPEAFRSTLTDLALGNVMAAAARDYQKEVIAQEQAQASSSVPGEIDLDELMNKEAEKRQVLERKGHGEYREVTEGEFLGEVTGSKKVICHFHHREFVRCKIVDKHLKLLAPKYFETKFIRVDAENAPFFVTKLAIKTLPCVILFRDGVATERLVGFQDLGGRDDFSTKVLENWLLKKGIIVPAKGQNEDEDDMVAPRSLRSSTNNNSDSD